MNADGCSLTEELQKLFGYRTFKSDLQRRAVTSVSTGKQNVFVSMPTGAGKSLCYQLPALLFSGVTIVFSPLIALIEDQITQLQSQNINAESLNSKTSSADRKRILADLHLKVPTIKLLYITPELAATSHFRSELDHLHTFHKLSLVAVDEAHCVSEWGHDFRPDYLKLGKLREAYSSVQWLALTATATSRVQRDILRSLHMGQDTVIFKAACFRDNIFYDVKFKEILRDPLQDLSKFLAKALGLGALAGRPSSQQSCAGSGIIYCRTRDGCSMLAGRLTNKGILAKAYHAGLPAKERSEIQQQWMEGICPVIVATVSFGMGIDKANVRFVAHWTMPKSMEAYYQESGRAGRDGQQSFCRIYYSKSDRNELVFLLKQEAQKKSKKKKGYSASGQGTVKEATQRSFEHLVEYCEKASCRHAAIADYFNDPKPQCIRLCDYCKDPSSTKNHTKDGTQLACKKPSMNASSSYGHPDPSMYGGGKWGHKRDEESDSDDEGSGHRPNRKRESLFDSDFFESEFRKRRRRGGSSPDEVEVPGTDCRLKDASNTTHIPKLSLKVRVHCLEKLSSALQTNLSSLHSGCARDPMDAAIDMEYDVFTAVKSSQTYKLRINDCEKEIKSSTKNCLLHSSLKEAVHEPPEVDLAQSEPGPSTSPGPTPGFVKASKLYTSENSHSSSEFISSDIQLRRDCNSGNGSSSSSSSIKYSMFTPASKLFLEASEAKSTADSSISERESNRRQNKHEDGFGKSVSDFMDNFDYGEEYRLPGQGDNGGPETPPANYGSATEQLEDSLEEQEENICVNDEHMEDPVLNESAHSYRAEKVEKTRSDSCEQEFSSSSPKNSIKSKTNISAQQVVASKNSLLGLDFHEPSPPPRPPSKASQLPRKLMSSNKKKQLVADTVVKHLNSYYKAKQISSKEIFKRFARRVSDYVLIEWSRVNHDLDGEIKSILHSYFSKHKAVKGDKDLSNLDLVLVKDKDS